MQRPRHLNRLTAAGIAVAAAIVFHGSPIYAEEAATPEATFNSECSACHMAFPPQFLPARSWQTLMGDLKHHFKENAGLDADTAKVITDYLVANSAETSRMGARMLAGIKDSDVPLRITDTPFWLQRHRRFTDADFSSPEVKSKVNCAACHR